MANVPFVTVITLICRHRARVFRMGRHAMGASFQSFFIRVVTEFSYKDFLPFGIVSTYFPVSTWSPKLGIIFRIPFLYKT